MIVAALEQHVQDGDARLAIIVETALDECGVTGTRDPYLRLAQLLIDFVANTDSGALDPRNFEGMKIYESTRIAKAFDPLCEVHLDSTWLTETEAERRQVRDYFHCEDNLPCEE